MKGKVIDYDGKTLTITANYEDVAHFIKQNVTECEIRLDDGRSISADQRKKIYATINDIAEWSGYFQYETKEIMKYQFLSNTDYDYFSLSSVDMTTASEFLQYLIEFCVEHGIASGNLIERAPDIARYLYACLYHKKCCICGRKADLHHVDTVGAGRNRDTIIHIGMMAEALCREHHTELGNIGQRTFDEKYHVFGIKLDHELCKIYNLKEK